MKHPSRLLPVVLSLFLLPVVPRAQTAEESQQPKLKSSEITGLAKKIQDYFAVLIKQTDFDNSLSGKTKSKSDRKKLRKFRNDANKKKAAFEKEFFKRAKANKVDLLSSVPDLMKIMDGCFPHKRMSNGGMAKRFFVLPKGSSDRYPYAVRWPKKYKPGAKSLPLIISLPPRVDGKWTKPKNWLEQDWPATIDTVLTDYIVAVPEFPEDSNLSKVYAKGEEMDAKSRQDVGRLLKIFGNLLATFRVDTNRIFLEASGESVPFALRIASIWPYRFAGLILKNPKGIQNCVADNLSLVPTLILSDAGNKGTGQALAKMLAQAKLIEVEGDLPFADKGGEIAEWMGGVQRPLFSPDLTYTPVLDAFRKAYWVRILNAELVADKQPRLEVHADRKTNKISLKAENIGAVLLLLNDAIVDMDKEITIEINGKVVQQLKKTRKKSFIWGPSDSLIMFSGDQSWIFTAAVKFDVPRTEEESSKTETSEGSDK